MKQIVSIALCLPLLLVGGASRAAEEEAEATTVESVAAPSTLQIVPAWRNNDVTGSVNRFGKYLTPAQDGYLESLSYTALRGDFPALRLQVFAPGQPGTSGYLRWEDPFPRAFAELSTSRYRFHLYPEVNGASIRDAWLLAAGTYMSDNKTFVGLNVGREGLRIVKPGTAIDWGTTDLGLAATRHFGSGDAVAAVALREYDSRNLVQPGARHLSYSARYIQDIAGLASVGVDYRLTAVRQAGSEPQTQVIGLRAVSPAGSNLVATARFNATNLTGAVARNAYTRSSNTARVDVRYRGVRNLQLRAGYNRYEYSRVNRFQVQENDSAWNNMWVSGSYRPLPRWQVLAKAAYRDNPNPPASGLNDPLPLALNLDRSAELRVQGAPTDNTVVYLTTATRFRRNTRRNVEVQQDTASLGGWVQLWDRLSLNADYSVLSMDSRNLALQALLADAHVTTLGASMGLPRQLSVDASYSNYRASRAQEISQNVWGVNLRRALTAGTAWNLEFRRDEYRDAGAPAQSYTANVVSVGGSARF